MLQFFLMAKSRPTGRDPRRADGTDIWIRDPLAHPDIAAMDERQRADLPFPAFPSTKAACEGSTRS